MQFQMNELGLPMNFGVQRNFAKHNQGYVPHKKRSLSNRLDFNIDIAYNKVFTFFPGKSNYKNQICRLPDPSLLFQEDRWQIEDFQLMKVSLNNTKSKLNNLTLKDWHQHTRNTNVAGDVIRKLRSAINPEFLTQAWCKMYECLMSFWLIPEDFDEDVINTVHLCEAPGAFISALNHFLQTWYPNIEWDWLATTLNPYYEGNPLSHMIPDDRFILHTLNHWTFGQDRTGNLMDMDNLRHLQAAVETRLNGNVMLVTADGSIDCQTNPAEQETIVAPLHYCETLTALSILRPGGSFMLKMFTVFECESICLLYLLVCVFREVSMFKPVKSKEGNSEVYVLCIGYEGKEYLAPWMPFLYGRFGPSIPKAMFSEGDIPNEFIIQVYECAKKFTDLQTRVIDRNLDMFFSPSPTKISYSRLLKKQVADKYLDHYELQPVEKVVIGNDILSDTRTINLAQKQEEGTFNDRVRKACEDSTEHIEQLWASVQDLACQWPFSSSVCWFMFYEHEIPQLDLTLGQPIGEVSSSKFCNSRMLEVYYQVQSGYLLTSPRTEVETSVTVDVTHFPWDTCTSHCHRLLLECLSRALKKLPPTKSMCVRGLPLFTQLSVATILLLAHSFYQMGLSVEGNVILCGYQQARNNTQWIDTVLSQMSGLPPSRAVLSILPINVLCDPSYCMSDGISFYLSVSSINNARLLESIREAVERIQQRRASSSPREQQEVTGD